MIEQQRKTEIMSRLRREGFVSVADLMSQLQASRSSIMRDLIDLEKSGLLERTRGGAALKSSAAVLTFGTELPTQEKKDIHAKQKQRIGAIAAGKIRPHSTIYLDSGTTTAYLLPHLSDKHVTIITPSMYVLRHLPVEFNGNIYILGGAYNRKYDMNFGSVTNREAGEYRYDAAVISASVIQRETEEV
ncbi:MAG: DeoR/GlpR transcriptional regulator, partial [Solobacterium sp.]|nr:DeoR/GlpR transcriptional regulator [Solobacterium sp.]